MTGTFHIFQCIRDPKLFISCASSGDECAEDRDGCADNPCTIPIDVNVTLTCSDLTPAEEAQLGRGYNCTSNCANGLQYSVTEQECHGQSHLLLTLIFQISATVLFFSNLILENNRTQKKKKIYVMEGLFYIANLKKTKILIQVVYSTKE